jgi:hypothetical protein
VAARQPEAGRFNLLILHVSLPWERVPAFESAKTLLRRLTRPIAWHDARKKAGRLHSRIKGWVDPAFFS